MQALTNSQASIDDSSPYKVCCGSDDADIGTNCFGEHAIVLRFSGENNAHVQWPDFYEYLQHNLKTCLSTTTPNIDVTCQYS